MHIKPTGKVNDPPVLLHACKPIYAEAGNTLYAEALFYAEHPYGLHYYLDAFHWRGGPQRQNLMSRIRVESRLDENDRFMSSWISTHQLRWDQIETRFSVAGGYSHWTRDPVAASDALRQYQRVRVVAKKLQEVRFSALRARVILIITEGEEVAHRCPWVGQAFKSYKLELEKREPEDADRLREELHVSRALRELAPAEHFSTSKFENEPETKAGNFGPETSVYMPHLGRHSRKQLRACQS